MLFQFSVAACLIAATVAIQALLCLLGCRNVPHPSSPWVGAFEVAFATSSSPHRAPLLPVMKEQLRMLASAHPMSPRRFEQVQGLRRIVYDSEDYAEGIRAFKEKKAQIFGKVARRNSEAGP
jgi:hypothetical protein